MMKSRKITIGLPVVVCVLFMAFLLFPKDHSFGKITKTELRFGENYINYVVPDQDTMAFNILGVLKSDSSLQDLVTSVDTNNPNIKVVDYKADTGTEHKGYKLVNIILTIEVLSDDIEKADQLLIQFNNEEPIAFDMGLMVIQNDKGFQRHHLEPTGNYNVGYPRLELDVILRNISSQSLTPVKISDLTNFMSYHFDNNVLIESKEEEQIQIERFDVTKRDQYDFMTLTPILEYTINEETYRYNMPGVIYGILDQDTKKIEKILD
ncbi:hypothetical protein [Pseudalkalibacillus sp. SCS-8]|uniref:hypothetical protein n=1 Tax=Pseudalkalibacillus nanhaiensis TaxID=3115291 RepID=UPI0032DA1592